MRRFVCIFGLLALPWLSAGPVRAQAAAQDSWQALVARDARVSFSPRTGLLATAVLRSEDASKERRSAAWLALGAVGGGELRTGLFDSALRCEGIERKAAILGLGELGQGVDGLLLELARNEDIGLAGTALLALLRTHSPALRSSVEAIAADSKDPRTHVAAKLLVFVGDPGRSEPTAAARLWLELRWRAAREFGLVDGQAWRVLVYRELGARPEFCSEVILRAAAALDRPGVRDLLLGALLHGKGPGRLRAAARGIPRELALLVQNGLWKPADVQEWSVLFDELEQQHLEAYTPELFEAALAEPALKARALELCSRSGAQDLATLIDECLPKASVEERVFLCRAMAASEDASYLGRLGVQAAAKDPPVRAAALVGSLLLGSHSADAALRSALAKDDPLRGALLAELAANAHFGPALVLLQDEFPRAKDDTERRVLALALAREGMREARAWCREALTREPPPPPEDARELLAALRARLTSEDTETVRTCFPREDTPENLALNIELALALVELGDGPVYPLLQAALWKSSFEVSLLAGALLAQVSGMHALREEAANPPASARSSDVRRVGFALGCFGGLPELEALSKRLRYNSGSPALQGGLLGFLSTRTQ
jgi:hypothetical protein